MNTDMARMDTDLDAENLEQIITYEKTNKQSLVIQIYFSNHIKVQQKHGLDICVHRTIIRVNLISVV